MRTPVEVSWALVAVVVDIVAMKYGLGRAAVESLFADLPAIPGKRPDKMALRVLSAAAFINGGGIDRHAPLHSAR